MSIDTLPEPTGGDFVNLESGTYVGVCYRFLDLGTHDNTYQGVTTPRHEILIGWETPFEIMPAQDGREARPFVINKRYTWSMSTKSNLRKDLESWRGKPFQQSDFGPSGFKPIKLIGAACMLGIVTEEKNGKTYSNVTSISPIYKDLKGKVPALVNRAQYLDLDATKFDRDVFGSLHDRLKEKIAASPEYQAIFNGPRAEYLAAQAREQEEEETITF